MVAYIVYDADGIWVNNEVVSSHFRSRSDPYSIKIRPAATKTCRWSGVEWLKWFDAKRRVWKLWTHLGYSIIIIIVLIKAVYYAPSNNDTNRRQTADKIQRHYTNNRKFSWSRAMICIIFQMLMKKTQNVPNCHFRNLPDTKKIEQWNNSLNPSRLNSNV